jgi:hypothetical protein
MLMPESERGFPANQDPPSTIKALDGREAKADVERVEAEEDEARAKSEQRPGKTQPGGPAARSFGQSTDQMISAPQRTRRFRIDVPLLAGAASVSEAARGARLSGDAKCHPHLTVCPTCPFPNYEL